MEKRPCRVTFIVPALNEETVIENVVRDIWSMVDSSLATYEIVLVDDGSIDRTGTIMDRLAQELAHVRVLHNKRNAGLGASYQRGLVEAKLDYVMMLCGDGGLPASSLPPIIDKIGTADIVIPYILNLSAIKTPFRYLASRAYTRLLNCISGCRLHYYNGLPVHRRQLLDKIVIVSSGFGFQGEIIVRLLRQGATYVEVGVVGSGVGRRSSALRMKNILSVAATIGSLLSELVFRKHREHPRR